MKIKRFFSAARIKKDNDRHSYSVVSSENIDFEDQYEVETFTRSFIQGKSSRVCSIAESI
jgi:hypothetical protein